MLRILLYHKSLKPHEENRNTDQHPRHMFLTKHIGQTSSFVNPFCFIFKCLISELLILKIVQILLLSLFPN